MNPIQSLVASLVLASLAPFACAAETPTLYVYTWEDYFPAAEVEAFEREHGCEVEFSYYDSNETMLAKLSEGGGYDVVTPPPSMARPLFDAGKLQPLDHSLLPDIGNIDANSTLLADDPEMRYSIPYTGTITGIGYNRNMVSRDEVESWAVFANKRLEKRMTMLNDSREVIGAALKYLGHSINSTNPDEIGEAGKIVREWKGNIAMFNVDDAKEGLRNGTYAAIQAYSGDVAMLASSNPGIAFSVPREGAALNADVFAIASDSERPDLAHAFINHFLDAAAARNTMLEIKYYMPNTAALESMDAASLEIIGFNKLSPAVREKCEGIHDLGESASLYDDAWAEILFDGGN